MRQKLTPQIVFTGRPFSIRVEPVCDGDAKPRAYVATAAKVSFSGETVEEAVSSLCNFMIDHYRWLSGQPALRLGKIPQQQLIALRKILRTTESKQAGKAGK